MIQDRNNFDWTEEDDEKLRILVILKREKNWEKISKEIQGKSPSQCKNRWKTALSPSIVKVTERRKWVPEEDDNLTKLVKKYGIKNWRIIASHLRGRLPKQCRERWINHLDPTIVKGRLTEKEWKHVLDAHEELGNRWSEIAKLLPGRTPNQIKNHWHAMVRKSNKRKYKDYCQEYMNLDDSSEREVSPRSIGLEHYENMKKDVTEAACSPVAMDTDSISTQNSEESLSDSHEQKRKKIRLNGNHNNPKLDALVQIAEYMYQTESKIADISISNLTTQNESFYFNFGKNDFFKDGKKDLGTKNGEGSLFGKLCNPVPVNDKMKDEELGGLILNFGKIGSFVPSNDMQNKERSIFV
jgi:hypothetical protein